MYEILLSGRGPNMLSLAMLERFDAELEAGGAEPLLVTGAGEAFSSGLDLDELRSLDGAGLERLLLAMERVTRRLYHHPAPTVALVNGHAVAGGCLLAQCCDVRIAVDSPKTRIGMTGVAIGLVYPPFVLEVFRHRVPAPGIETALLSAKRFSVAEALALGLVDHVVKRDEARAAAEAALAERAALPRHAYAALKLALRSAPPERDAAQRHFFAEVLPSWAGAVERSTAATPKPPRP